MSHLCFSSFTQSKLEANARGDGAGIQEYQRLLADQTAQISDLKAQLAIGAVGQLAEMTDSHSDELMALRSKLQSLEQTHQEVEISLQQSNHTVVHLNAQLKAQQETLNVKEEDLQTLRSQFAGVCEDLRLSMDEVDSVKASIAEASLNNTKPSLEREAAAEALRQATLQNEQFGEEMQQLKADQADKDQYVLGI